MTRQRIVKQYFPIGGDFKEERQAAVKYKKQRGKKSRNPRRSTHFKAYNQIFKQQVLANSVVVHRIAIREGPRFGSSRGGTFSLRSMLAKENCQTSIFISRPSFKFITFLTPFTTPFNTGIADASSVETEI